MKENKHTMSDLYQMQSLPLDAKIRMTEYRIKQWVEEFGEDGVYISFSGGKDSTVLLDIARKIYPDIKAMFVDVPTQYPELKEFVMTYDNVDILKPKIGFVQVCEKYGFPLISKEVNEFYNDYMDKISNRTSNFESLYSEIERYSNSRSDEEYLIASELLSNALAKRESEVTDSEIRYFAP